ncbi:MAG: hypothetical protein ACRCWR_08540 [Saezia sp.]
MHDFAVNEKKTYQFKCIPPAFIKLVIGVGALLFMTVPFIAIYLIMDAPWLKVPGIIALVAVGISLAVLKEKWKDRYKLTITSASLIVQINGKLPPMEFAHSQIERLSVSPFVDRSGNEVSKLSLVDANSKTVFSIKILNQSKLVMEFLEAWQKASSAEMKMLYKNGALHVVERVGEIIGGFSKSTNIARIDFISPAIMK